MHRQNASYKKLSYLDLFKVLAVFFLGGIFFALLQMDFIAVSCLWKVIFNIPCPGCGLSRAFTLIVDFRFFEAMKMNIISIPLFIGGVITIIATFYEMLCRKPLLNRIYHFVKHRSTIVFAILLTVASWGYNLARSI
jgi:hypothetical protein